MKRRMLPATSMKNDSSEIRCKHSSQLMLTGNHSAHEDLASVAESLQCPNSCIRGPGCGLGELHQTAFPLPCSCRGAKARGKRGPVYLHPSGNDE